VPNYHCASIECAVSHALVRLVSPIDREVLDTRLDLSLAGELQDSISSIADPQ
jgi:hypothetical protein